MTGWPRDPFTPTIRMWITLAVVTGLLAGCCIGARIFLEWPWFS